MHCSARQLAKKLAAVRDPDGGGLVCSDCFAVVVVWYRQPSPTLSRLEANATCLVCCCASQHNKNGTSPPIGQVSARALAAIGCTCLSGSVLRSTDTSKGYELRVHRMTNTWNIRLHFWTI